MRTVKSKGRKAEKKPTKAAKETVKNAEEQYKKATKKERPKNVFSSSEKEAESEDVDSDVSNTETEATATSDQGSNYEDEIVNQVDSSFDFGLLRVMLASYQFSCCTSATVNCCSLLRLLQMYAIGK